MMEIIKYPNEILTNISTDTIIDKEIISLAKNMLETMISNRGIGLAAPQIGKNINMFVMNHDHNQHNNKIFINPAISTFGNKDSDIEGCLSLPSIFARIVRHSNVIISYTNIDGIEVEEEYSDLQARIIQHEYDHLLGVTLIDKMSTADKIKNKLN